MAHFWDSKEHVYLMTGVTAHLNEEGMIIIPIQSGYSYYIISPNEAAYLSGVLVDLVREVKESL